MTHTIRFPTLASAIAALICLVTLASTGSNEAVAQGTYGNAQAYYNGYGAGYNNGYVNGYGRYGGYGYTGYGNGPYGFRSEPYGYSTSSGYGYSYGTYNRLYDRALRLHGGTYRPLYSPNARFYSPYGRAY